MERMVVHSVDGAKAAPASPLKRRAQSNAGLATAAAGQADAKPSGALLDLMLTTLKERQLATGELQPGGALSLPIAIDVHVQGAAAGHDFAAAPIVRRRRCCGGLCQHRWFRVLVALLVVAAVALAAGLGAGLGARRAKLRLCPLGPRLDTSGLHLLFADDFSAGSLSTDSWSIERGDGGDFGISGWGNAEEQCYTDSPSNVDVIPHPDLPPDQDGVLRLQPVLLPAPQPCINAGGAPGWTLQWTSGKVHTKNKLAFSWQPGAQVVRGAAAAAALPSSSAPPPSPACGVVVVEGRIRAPLAAGLWSAFWMLPRPVACATTQLGECGAFGGWPRSGEIDISETVNTDAQVLSTVHYSRWLGMHAQSGGVLAANVTPDPGAASEAAPQTMGWITHQLVWNCSSLAAYANGTLVMSVTREQLAGSGSGAVWPFDEPFYLILNLAIGGLLTRGTSPNAGAGSVQPLLIDYVHVWGSMPAG